MPLDGMAWGRGVKRFTTKHDLTCCSAARKRWATKTSSLLDWPRSALLYD